MTDGPTNLPADAATVLARWRALRKDGAAPVLHELAPGAIPADLLPWTMTLKRDAARDIVYGVVGESLGVAHAANPRGRPFLYYSADDATRARAETVHRALDTGTPFWVVSKSLPSPLPVTFGRLALPARTADGDVLLILYFKLPAVPLADIGPIWLSDPPD